MCFAKAGFAEGVDVDNINEANENQIRGSSGRTEEDMHT